MNKTKIVFYSVSGLLVLLIVMFLGTWISTNNQASEYDELMYFRKTQIYVAIDNRYSKVLAYQATIQTADNQILTQLGLITQAREAFAEAIENQIPPDQLEEDFTALESMFITLVSYMEDNPGNWTTVGITSAFLAEYNASTNAVSFAINQYNETVFLYNSFLRKFPNNMVSFGYELKNAYSLPSEFVLTLPYA